MLADDCSRHAALFFFQAEDGIRDLTVTGVQTCALPISMQRLVRAARVLPVLLILGVGACQAFLDVNQNPNAPENAAVDVRLPALITEVVHSTYYGENAPWSAAWTPQVSFTSHNRPYSQVHRYEL